MERFPADSNGCGWSKTSGSQIERTWFWFNNFKWPESGKNDAQIIGKECGKRIIYDPDLREINNGLLAGMDNSLAEILFPGTYYNTLDLNEKYPNGESPIDFFNRIRKVYQKLLTLQKDILVVTHSGVINAMFCLINNLEFTNKKQEIIIDHAEFVVYYF